MLLDIALEAPRRRKQGVCFGVLTVVQWYHQSTTVFFGNVGVLQWEAG